MLRAYKYIFNTCLYMFLKFLIHTYVVLMHVNVVCKCFGKNPQTFLHPFCAAMHFNSIAFISERKLTQ